MAIIRAVLRARFRSSQVVPLLCLLLARRLAFTQSSPPDRKADAPKITARIFLSDLEPLRDRSAREAELFYAAVRVEWTRGAWGARAEMRGKDDRFRPYFRGDVWLEEGYAFLTTKLGELRVGKVERETFLPDDTFQGNLFSEYGVTRNPDFGAALVGDRRFGYDKLAWTAAFYGQNDHVAFEREGVGVESDPGATLRDGLEARLAYTVDKGLFRVTPGAAVATARIVRDTGPEVRRTDGSFDVTAAFGPLSLSGGLLFRSGERARADDPDLRLGYDDATAALVSFRAEFPTVLYRYTYTEWRAHGAGWSERLHQPAVVWTPVRGIEATIEYEARRLERPSGGLVDNAFRLGLALSY